MYHVMTGDTFTADFEIREQDILQTRLPDNDNKDDYRTGHILKMIGMILV